MSERNSQTSLRSAALLLAVVWLAGCGGRIPAPKAADPRKAATSLQATLDKWKNGASIDALRQEQPVVHAVDEDWQAGLKLISYELRDVVDDGGAFARIPVRLNIQSPNGQLWKEVEYDVQTEPQVSIVRRFE